MTLLDDFKADYELRKIDHNGMYYFYSRQFCRFLRPGARIPLKSRETTSKPICRLLGTEA